MFQANTANTVTQPHCLDLSVMHAVTTSVVDRAYFRLHSSQAGDAVSRPILQALKSSELSVESDFCVPGSQAPGCGWLNNQRLGPLISLAALAKNVDSLAWSFRAFTLL